jgi:hypothetical protein
MLVFLVTITASNACGAIGMFCDVIWRGGRVPPDGIRATAPPRDERFCQAISPGGLTPGLSLTGIVVSSVMVRLAV